MVSARSEVPRVNMRLPGLYLAAVFLAMIAPGPDMQLILASRARGGARAGLLATLGVISSEVAQITAVAAGLAAITAAAGPAGLGCGRRNGHPRAGWPAGPGAVS
jgi:hypothetical protein